MTSDAVHYLSLMEVSGRLRRGELIGTRAIQSWIDLRKRWLPGGAAVPPGVRMAPSGPTLAGAHNFALLPTTAHKANCPR